MKKNIVLCVVLMGFCLAADLPARAEDYLLPKDVEFSADFSYYTKYISRGFTNDDDPVLQAGLNLGYKGLTLTIWNSQDIRNQEGVNSDEVDYIVEYAYTIDKLTLSLGHAYFDYPAWKDSPDYKGTNDNFSKEVSLGIAYDTFLSPALSWKHDYSNEDSGGGKGDYLVLDLSKSFPLDKGINMNLSGHIGYNSDYYIEGTGGDLALTLGCSLPLTDKIACTPSITYSTPYGDQADDNDSVVYGGITVSY